MYITSAIAKAHLDKWLAADLSVAEGKAYAIGDRSLTRVDAEEIRANITHWQNLYDQAVAYESGGRSPAALACWNACR